MKYCPHCETLLDAETEVYVMAGEVLGCDNCIRTAWADEFFDEEELLEMEQDRRDQMLWDEAKDARYGL
jgi:hypothetical protein